MKSNTTKPELVILDRKGVPIEFNPFSTDNLQKNEAIFAPSGAGMRMLEEYKENSGGMGTLTANAMYEMAKEGAVKPVVVDQGSSDLDPRSCPSTRKAVNVADDFELDPFKAPFIENNS